MLICGAFSHFTWAVDQWGFLDHVGQNDTQSEHKLHGCSHCHSSRFVPAPVAFPFEARMKLPRGVWPPWAVVAESAVPPRALDVDLLTDNDFAAFAEDRWLFTPAAASHAPEHTSRPPSTAGPSSCRLTRTPTRTHTSSAILLCGGPKLQL